MKMRYAGVALVVLSWSLASAQQGPSGDASGSQQPSGTSPATSSPAKLTAGANGVLSQDQIRDVVRKVAENDIANDRKQRDYTYLQRQEERKLDSRGQVKSTESKTYEVMVLYGEQVRRLVAKDDKPLPEPEAARQEERIQKLIEKRKNESDEDRQKRLKKEEKERDDERQFVLEVADAYTFRLAGIEKLDGRDTYVIDGDPRPGYQPHNKDAKFLPKFRVRVWIDKAETQWVKLDAQAIDTVSWGLFLARLHKGSRVVVEQTRVNDEVWLPRHVAARVDAKVALMKSYDLDMDVTFSDYKKFRTETRIVRLGGADPPR